jgi:hypothetical protein
MGLTAHFKKKMPMVDKQESGKPGSFKKNSCEGLKTYVMALKTQLNQAAASKRGR